MHEQQLNLIIVSKRSVPTVLLVIIYFINGKRIKMLYSREQNNPCLGYKTFELS